MSKAAMKSIPGVLPVLAAAILTFVSIVHACTIATPIWGYRDKNADLLFKFVRDGKVGFIDASGKIVLDATRPGGSRQFHEGLLAVRDKDGFGYIDRSGKLVFRLDAWIVFDFAEGLAPAATADHSWGFIDRTGRFAVPPRFWFVYRFSEGLARVSVSGEFNSVGYINKEGRFVVPPRLSEGSDFHEGLAAVIIEGPCRITNGGSCERAEFQPEKLPATYTCRYTYIDKNGKPISDSRFDDAEQFSEGLAAVRIGPAWGYIDKSGRMVIPPKYQSAGAFSEGLAPVQLELKTGFIDHSGRIVIPPQFRSAESFSNGRALIRVPSDRRLTSYYQFIDKTGRTAFPGSFTSAGGFISGLAPVAFSSGKVGWIDTSGKTVFTYTSK
jgi:hypothetical protein